MDDERSAFLIASENMDAELRTNETLNFLRDRVIQNLVELLERPDFQTASQELLLETLVMIWGAFENLVSETIRVLLNANPPLAAKLLGDEATKKHFPSRGIPIEDLATHDFNLATSKGDLLLKDRHLDSLPIIKDVLRVVFKKEVALRDRLANRDLWLLWQRRHLIVHRRGVIDTVYLARTSESAPIGSRLSVQSNYVEASFVLIVDTAVELLRAVTNCDACTCS